MAADDEQLFAAVSARIMRTMLAVAAAGSIIALAWRGWRAGFGFAVGAILSWVNFRWLKGFVESLGPSSKPVPSQARATLLFALRYLLLGTGGYVILRYSKISVGALLAGLFVALAAVIVETAIQAAYGRNLDH